MPWNETGGSDHGGGPWGQNNPPNNNSPSPWSGGSRKPNGFPSDLNDFIRRAQEKLKSWFTGDGDFNANGWGLLLIAAAAVWLASGFYIVSTKQVGLNMRFGAFTGRTGEGLNYNWPTPIGSVIKVDVTDLNTIDIGADPQGDRPEESLMLTGDDNIADVKFRVVWKVDANKPEQFAFNIAEPQGTVKAVAESAMREAVGRSQIQRLFTNERKVVEPAVQELMQKILSSYHSGVEVVQVQLLTVKPPVAVAAAFNDVVAAQQDRDRAKNDADGYANKVVPEARGEAAGILQAAEAYREQTVAEARGQAGRFDKVYQQYKKAPNVTRQRLYLETMERVLGSADKVVMDRVAGDKILPLLQLNERQTNDRLSSDGHSGEAK